MAQGNGTSTPAVRRAAGASRTPSFDVGEIVDNPPYDRGYFWSRPRIIEALLSAIRGPQSLRHLAPPVGATCRPANW